MKTNVTFLKLKLFYYWSLSILGVSCVIYVSNKGIDFTDESFILNFTNPDIKVGPSAMRIDLFFKSIWNILGIRLSILENRLLNLFGMIIGSCFLWKNLKSNNSKIYELALFIVALFSSYCFGTTSVSYNSLIGILSLIYIGLFIKYLNSKNNVFLATIQGVLIYLIYLTKAPSGILTFVFSSFILCIHLIYKRDIISLEKFLFYLIINTVLFFALFQILPETSLKNVLESLKQIDSSHDPFRLIKKFAFESIFILFFFFFGFSISQIKLKIKQEVLKKTFFNAGIFSLTIYCLYLNYISTGHFVCLVYFTTFILGFSFKDVFIDANINKDWRIIAILLFTPIILSAGTNNPLHFQVLIYVFFWVFLIYYLNKRVLLSTSFMISFTFILAMGVFRNLIRSPYRQQPISHNVIPHDFLGSTHYITNEQFNTIISLKNIIKKEKLKGLPILTDSKMHGEILFLEAVYPCHPYWNIQNIEVFFSQNKLDPKFIFVTKNSSLSDLEVISNYYECTLIGKYINTTKRLNKSEISCFLLKKRGKSCANFKQK